MTKEARERLADEVYSGGAMVTCSGADLRALLDDHARLTAEVAEAERLRSLPVIETCRMCGHCEVGPARPAPRTPWLPGERRRLVDFCNAKDWRRTVTEADDAPPSWCPLRKAGGR